MLILLRCYPKITDWIYLIFNQSPAADYRFLPIFSYGFFVAVGFVFAATLATLEMKRREKLGLMPGLEKEITVGEAPKHVDLALTFLIGFVAFFKIFGVIVFQPELSTHVLSLMDFMKSPTLGSWSGGILGGLVLAGLSYYQQHKARLPQPEKKKIKVYPSDNIGDLVVIAAIFGVLGSNFFNFLENPDDYKNFWDNPLGSMFSGLSVYGGLICAGAAFAVYARIKKIPIPHFFDAVAPAFILANGIGRIGCQVSGDGDWGVTNLAAKPGWMPQFMWADHYAHNIIDEGVAIANCAEEHCMQLANPSYPTPIYEFLMCTAIFFILWSLRKKLTYKPGMVFTIFMILIGIQRYAIEQWRDLSGRDLYHILGGAFKQSELISIILFIVGVAGTIYLYNYYKNKPNPAKG